MGTKTDAMFSRVMEPLISWPMEQKKEMWFTYPFYICFFYCHKTVPASLKFLGRFRKENSCNYLS